MKFMLKKSSTVYRVISNAKKIKLILLVSNEVSLVRAAKELDINYSTAKTIMRVFRYRNGLLKSKSNQKLRIFHIFKNDLNHFGTQSTNNYKSSKQSKKSDENSKNLKIKSLPELIFLCNVKNRLAETIIQNQQIINTFLSLYL